MTDIDISKIRQLDFTLLLIMQGLLRHRRTTDVAQELGLSQPAVSHALSRLRDLFDDPLFLRRAHGVEPTHHALALAPHVETMLHEASTAIGLGAQFDPETTTRNFRIGAPEHLASLVAGPLLQRMEQVAPLASFTLAVEIGVDAQKGVEQHQLDLAVGQFRLPVDRLNVTLLYKDEYVLVARADHPRIRSRIGKALFESLAHIVAAPSGSGRALVDDQLQREGIQRHIVARVPRFQTAFEVVASSDAVTIAPRRLAKFYAQAFGLAVYRPPFKLREIDIVLIRRPHPDPGLDWLADTLSRILTSAEQ